MGTRGYIVYRHRRRYYIQYNHYDSYPEGLGCSLLHGIPTSEEEFKEWLDRKRQILDQEYEEFLNDGLYSDLDGNYWIEDKAPSNDLFIEWIYTIDLDEMIFHINSRPFYRLDHMPPEDIFVAGISIDHYDHQACLPNIPAEYRYDSIAYAQPAAVLDDDLEIYERHKADPAVLPVGELLSHPGSTEISAKGSVRRALLQLSIGILLCILDLPIRFLPSVSNRHAFTATQQQMLRLCIEVVFIPTRLTDNFDRIKDSINYPKLGSTNADENSDFWWIRNHVCVLFDTHVNHERNLRAALGDLTSEILRKPSPPTVFGVAFSLSHIAIMRVDKTKGTFVHTECLPFLPSFFAESPSTPGITALSQLADIPADDDHEWSLQWLSVTYSGANNARVTSLAATDAARNLLPLELWMHVAQFIDSPQDLIAFGMTSKQTSRAASASPWLMYPHIEVRAGHAPCLLRGVASLPEQYFKDNMNLYSGAFEVLWKGISATLIISADESPRLQYDMKGRIRTSDLYFPGKFWRTEGVILVKGYILSDSANFESSSDTSEDTQEDTLEKNEEAHTSESSQEDATEDTTETSNDDHSELGN